MHWEGGRKGGGGGAVGGVQIQASLTRNVDHRPFLESTVEMNDGGGGGYHFMHGRSHMSIVV